MGQPSRQGSALFSARIELWRSTPEAIPKVLMKVRLRYVLSFAQKDRARFDGLGARRSNRLLFCQFVVSQPQMANPPERRSPNTCESEKTAIKLLLTRPSMSCGVSCCISVFAGTTMKAIAKPIPNMLTPASHGV